MGQLSVGDRRRCRDRHSCRVFPFRAADGHCEAGAVNRAFGCAAGPSDSGVRTSPLQSFARAGCSSLIPSTHIAIGGECGVGVDAVTPEGFHGVGVGVVTGAWCNSEESASGLIAYRRPSSPNFIQQMSSPMVSAFKARIVGTSIADSSCHRPMGTQPQCTEEPSGLVSFKMSMCSANHPASRAITEAMRGRNISFRVEHCLRTPNRTTRSHGSPGSGQCICFRHRRAMRRRLRPRQRSTDGVQARAPNRCCRGHRERPAPYEWRHRHSDVGRVGELHADVRDW